MTGRGTSIDLRAPVLGVVAWLSALAALLAPASLVGPALGLGCIWIVLRRRRGQRVLTQLAWLVAGAGVAASALLRADAVRDSAVAQVAGERASVDAEIVVTSDPVRRPGRFEDFVIFRARTQTMTGGGHRQGVRVPILVIADVSWQRLDLGSRLQTSGRLQPARTSDLAGVLSPRGPPVVVEQPGRFLRSAGRLRASIRDAVAGHPPGPRALVPALVDGDDGAMPEDLKEDFRTSGLTHLTDVKDTLGLDSGRSRVRPNQPRHEGRGSRGRATNTRLPCPCRE